MSVPLKARAQYTPRGDLGRFISTVITPAVVAGVTASTQILFDETQSRVHVRSGELKDSGRMDVEVTGNSVVGRVIYGTDHAFFNEFGTGRRGAASPMAGSYPYNPDWPGMEPIPFMRPALDVTRDPVRNAFADNMSLGLKK